MIYLILPGRQEREGMDNLERIVAEHACEAVVSRYTLAVNDWDLDAFVALFHADGEWQRPKVPLLSGRREIRAFMEAQPTPADRILRHIQAGVLVTMVSDDEAAVRSQSFVYESPSGELPTMVTTPSMIVEYRDRMTRDGADWRIARRDTTVVFVGGSP
jgi:ketosteroid isomerase-like protein